LKPNNKNNNTIITAANHERIMKMIKELDDIIRKTPEGEIRTDLEFTRDKLISSLYNENQDEGDEEKRKEEEEENNNSNKQQ
jgi:uncharacterized membrane-anchored protein YjiN (DUF445 family)